MSTETQTPTPVPASTTEAPAMTTSTPSPETSPAPQTQTSSSDPAPESPTPAKPEDQTPAPSSTDAEEYELELPDGSHLSDDEFNNFAAEAGRLKLSKDDAQKLLNSIEGSASSVHKQLQTQHETFIKEQRAAFDKDPDFIGEARTKSFESINRVVEKFGNDDFKKLLNTPGVGDNIHLAKFLKSLGDTMAPDTIEGSGHLGGAPETSKASWLKSQYPSMG